MCPFCLASVVWIAAATVSTTGAAALVISKAAASKASISNASNSQSPKSPSPSFPTKEDRNG